LTICRGRSRIAKGCVYLKIHWECWEAAEISVQHRAVECSRLRPASSVPGYRRSKKEATMTSYATKMVPEMSTVGEPVKTVGIVNPTENEIRTVAYQLWLGSGCPIGSDQEHWFRAEAMLSNALVAKCEDLSRRPPMCTESEIVAEFTSERWEGHCPSMGGASE